MMVENKLVVLHQTHHDLDELRLKNWRWKKAQLRVSCKTSESSERIKLDGGVQLYFSIVVLVYWYCTSALEMNDFLKNLWISQ